MSTEDVKSWIIEHSVRKSKIFNMVAHGNEGRPCLTNSGPNPGKICVFPFVFPDCGIYPQSNVCQTQNKVEALTYTKCTNFGNYKHWCSTVTYKNDSHKTGSWGYCPQYCLDNQRFEENLADEKFQEFWQEQLFQLVTDDIGLCYTYNPKHNSSTRPEDKFVALLGRLTLERLFFF